MISDLTKQKKETLLKEGWVLLESQFDFDYLIHKNPLDIFKDFGFFMSVLGEHLNKNPLSLLGAEINEARDNFVKTLCPIIERPVAPTNTPLLSASWPLIKKDYENMEASFIELTYFTIRKIVGNLGAPLNIYQRSLDESSLDIFSYPTDNFNLSILDNLTIFKKLVIQWDEVVLMINVSTSWHENGAIIEYSWNLYSNKLRQLTSNIMHNIGLELNPNTYQLGELVPQFKLNSFPEYIREFTNELQSLMFKDNKYPERFNLIVEGKPGYGKSCWAQAYASEILSPKGYLILCIDYSSLQSLVIPDYIDKVCIIVNDADTLALSRDISPRGETEQILSWLDGARTSFIKPFYYDKRTSVITIMTANSIEQWDEAALRQGRIHKIVQFDQVKLCDI